MPILNFPEICFFGRSNVGKSSLINQITKNKNLAKTSKTPGRTQTINFFLINNKIILADLPGYGYSKIPKKNKFKIHELLNEYFIKRQYLKKIYLLIDSKVGIKDNDFEAISVIGQLGISFAIVMTKLDKISKNNLYHIKDEIESLMKNYRSASSKILFTSSKKNHGIDEIQKSIYTLLK